MQKKNVNVSMVVIAAMNGKTRHVCIEVRIGDKDIKEQLTLFDTGVGVSNIGVDLARTLGKNLISQDSSTICNASDVMSILEKLKLALENKRKKL